MFSRGDGFWVSALPAPLRTERQQRQTFVLRLHWDVMSAQRPLPLRRHLGPRHMAAGGLGVPLAHPQLPTQAARSDWGSQGLSTRGLAVRNASWQPMFCPHVCPQEAA